MAPPSRYLDACAALGMQGPVDARVPWKTADLLADLRHTGLHGALVHHTLAREYDPAYGNRKLMDEIASAGPDAGRLLPCWVVLPHHAGEMPPGPALVRAMRDAGVRAAKAFPRRHHYTLEETTCGALVGALEEAAIPLLLDAGLFGDDLQVTLDEVDRLCARHPRLRVLLQKTRWESPRSLLPLLDRHAGLHVEMSSLQVHYGLEFFRDRVGIDRLLLGTDWPFKSPGAARAYVDYAELSDADRAAVAGGNLARLLGLGALPDAYPDDDDDGPILARAKRGLPLDHIPVVDPHTHVLHDGLMGSGFVPIPHGDAAHMIQRNRRLGVDLFCCSTWVGIWIDPNEGIALTRALEARYPDDFVPYAALDPRKSDDFEADVRLVHDTYGWRGIKPYGPRTGLPYNDPLYDAWYAKGNAVGAFVKLHQTAIGDGFYEQVADVAERFPNLTLMLAHAGWTWEVARARAAFAHRFPRVVLDLTFTSVLHGVVEFFCDEGLEDRVLFATDAPMRDAAPQFGWVAYARVTEEQKEKVLGRNALRMLAHAGLPVAETLRQRYGLSADFARRDGPGA